MTESVVAIYRVWRYKFWREELIVRGYDFNQFDVLYRDDMTHSARRMNVGNGCRDWCQPGKQCVPTILQPCIRREHWFATNYNVDTMYTSVEVGALLQLAVCRLSARGKDNACAHQYSFELNIGTRKACLPRRISIEAPADNMEMRNWKTTESGRAAAPSLSSPARHRVVCVMCTAVEIQTQVFETVEDFPPVSRITFRSGRHTHTHTYTDDPTTKWVAAVG